PTLLHNPRLALRRGLVCTASLAAGFGVTAWWNVLLAWHWGSPLFPFYNALFKSPYFDPINFYDVRWQFSSLAQFLAFLLAAVHGTAKTSELQFADARLLMYVTLLGLLMLLAAYKHLAPGRTRLVCGNTDVAQAFLWFFGVSFALWARVFANQRYLIPLE